MNEMLHKLWFERRKEGCFGETNSEKKNIRGRKKASFWLHFDNVNYLCGIKPSQYITNENEMISHGARHGGRKEGSFISSSSTKMVFHELLYLQRYMQAKDDLA